MTRMLAVLVLLPLGLAPEPARAQSSPYSGPIIDVHLHGGSVSEWGVEPPVGICSPFAHFRTWDPAQPYEEFFREQYLKGPPCPDPVWSPYSDDLLAVLALHPQVYVDIGAIVYTLPREEFYRYLRTIVQAGFGQRVMFGSDQMIWPETIERSIAVVQQAPFLSAEQEADIFYNSAARFFRLSEETISRHRAMTSQEGGLR